MQKSSFSFLVPSIQPHTFHLHLAILCSSARVLLHKEETKEASSNKLRRQNTHSFNCFFFVFFKEEEEEQEAHLLHSCQSSNPSAFYSPRSYLFPPPHLFRRALWRRRRTHKARPHFLPLVRVSIRPRERPLEGRIGGKYPVSAAGTADAAPQGRDGQRLEFHGHMGLWHPPAKRALSMNYWILRACVYVHTYMLIYV